MPAPDPARRSWPSALQALRPCRSRLVSHGLVGWNVAGADGEVEIVLVLGEEVQDVGNDLGFLVCLKPTIPVPPGMPVQAVPPQGCGTTSQSNASPTWLSKRAVCQLPE